MPLFVVYYKGEKTSYVNRVPLIDKFEMVNGISITGYPTYCIHESSKHEAPKPAGQQIKSPL
jgi:hypothetical protein